MATFLGKEHNKASVQGDIATPLWDLLIRVVQGIGGLRASRQPVQAATQPVSLEEATKQMQAGGWKVAEQNPTPSPVNSGEISEPQIKQGFLKYSSNSPLATQSAVLAAALQQLHPNIDPKVVLGLLLKESGGGRDLVGRQQGLNNNLNVMHHVNGQRRLVNYPDLQTALTGGPNPLEDTDSQGIINILNTDPRYNQFRTSGNPSDLLRHFTPFGGENPDENTQLRQLQEAMRYFR